MKCGNLNGPYCILGHFQGKPTDSDCLSCKDYDGTSRGLGDDITRLIRKMKLESAGEKLSVSFKSGCGCAKRRKRWNELFPHESED